MRDAGHGSTGLRAQTLHIDGNTRSVVESENVNNRSCKSITAFRGSDIYKPRLILVTDPILKTERSVSVISGLKDDVKCHEHPQAVIEPHDDIEIGDYLVCRYDTHCWVGVTIEVSSENKDVAIKFLHPHLPCVSFMWPRRGDVRWVPTSNILKKVQPPKPSTMTGRQYTFEPKDALEIEL
eukprot:gene3943-15274_t